MSEPSPVQGGAANFRQALAVYKDWRMLRLALLGLISGFPWVLIGSALSLWLKEEGLSRTTIGWAGLIFTVYAFNFLWAPLVDRIQIPYLTQRLGHRRAWIVSLQLVILASLGVWSVSDPSANLQGVILVGLIIAIASATQDITIDALRIEQIGQRESNVMAAGAAVAVMGWWTGYKLGGVAALTVAQGFQDAGVTHYWQATFLVLGLVVIFCNIALIFVPEPSSSQRADIQKTAQRRLQAQWGHAGVFAVLLSWLGTTLLSPLASFFRKNGFAIALAILGFVFLFKIGEAFLGRMSLIFYKEIGFSKTDIALYSKGLGWVTTVVFTLAGSLFAVRVGLIRAMFLAGILMALTNLLFSFLAWSEKSEWFFALAVVMDDLTGAFATVVFVAFISMLVDRTYTATQYALLASVGTAGRTLFASWSGAMVDWLDGDWGLFFVITALMVLPSLWCLWAIRRQLAALLTGAQAQIFRKSPS